MRKVQTDKQYAESKELGKLTGFYSRFSDTADEALTMLHSCVYLGNREGELGITRDDFSRLCENVDKAKEDCIAKIVRTFRQHEKLHEKQRAKNNLHIVISATFVDKI